MLEEIHGVGSDCHDVVLFAVGDVSAPGCLVGDEGAFEVGCASVGHGALVVEGCRFLDVFEGTCWLKLLERLLIVCGFFGLREDICTVSWNTSGR